MTLMKSVARALMFASVTLGAGLAATSAHARPPMSAPMPVSTLEAAPPAGFAQFCARLPEQCGNRQARPSDASRSGSTLYSVTSAARPGAHFDWQAVFSTAPAKGRQGYDWTQALSGDAASLNDVTEGAGPVATVEMSGQLWTQLHAVTRDINKKIAPRTDEEAFGVRDLWVMPLSEGLGAQGNCKHYVLEKRQALAALGVPRSAMSIAVARTPWGEIHAVLVVATNQGDYVLDNLSPWVKPWRETGYSWISRQRRDDPGRFAQVAMLN